MTSQSLRPPAGSRRRSRPGTWSRPGIGGHRRRAGRRARSVSRTRLVGPGPGPKEGRRVRSRSRPKYRRRAGRRDGTMVGCRSPAGPDRIMDARPDRRMRGRRRRPGLLFARPTCFLFVVVARRRDVRLRCIRVLGGRCVRPLQDRGRRSGGIQLLAADRAACSGRSGWCRGPLPLGVDGPPRREPGLARRSRASRVLWLLALPPVALELYHGNIHLWIAAAIVLGFRYPWTWAFVLLTKVTPGVGARLVRRPTRVALAGDRRRRDRRRRGCLGVA